jgi:small subunit ribosomal protein S13
MARIQGVEIPDKKRVVISLTYIYGIGLKTSQKLLSDLKIDESIRTKDLKTEQIKQISDYIDKNITVEGFIETENISGYKKTKRHKVLQRIKT